MHSKEKVIILGGGFSGLWVGCQLLKEGYKVEILEKEKEAGGLLRTIRCEDFYLDLGPHIYPASHKHRYEAFLSEPLHPIHAYYGFAFRGRQIRSPLTPQNLFVGLTFRDALRLIASVGITKLTHFRSQEVPQNAKEWCIAKYGKLGYSSFFEHYIPKVTGLPAHRVAPEWGTERERFYKEHNLWQQSLKPFVKLILGKNGRGEGLQLYYLPGGSIQIIQALQNFILSHGGTVRLGVSVKKTVLGSDQQGKKVLFGENDTLKEIEGDRFISTLPLTEFIKHIESVPPSVWQAAHALRFRHLWLFYYVINRPFLTDKIQIYFPEKEYLFKRIYEIHPLHNKPHRTAICVEVCYGENDAIIRMPEEELSQVVKEQISRFYGLRSEEFLKAFSVKVPFAYAVYEQRYREHLETIASFLFRINNLISYGRSGLFRYNLLTDRIIDAAETTLDFIMSGRSKREFLGKVNPAGDFL